MFNNKIIKDVEKKKGIKKLKLKPTYHALYRVFFSTPISPLFLLTRNDTQENKHVFFTKFYSKQLRNYQNVNFFFFFFFFCRTVSGISCDDTLSEVPILWYVERRDARGRLKRIKRVF